MCSLCDAVIGHSAAGRSGWFLAREAVRITGRSPGLVKNESLTMAKDPTRWATRSFTDAQDDSAWLIHLMLIGCNELHSPR